MRANWLIRCRYHDHPNAWRTLAADMSVIGRPKGIPVKDYTGMRFNRLVALRRSNEMRRGCFAWVYLCDCGNKKTLSPRDVLNGDSQSCGCLKLERIRSLNKGTHNKSNTREWNSWRAMRKRCLDKNYHAYSSYAGRGIEICERWGAFTNFLEDMGPRPPGTSLDRIDNNKGYYKENCRWADPTTQGLNKRGVRNVSFNGQTMCISEWSRATKIPMKTIWNRLDRGWPIELVFSNGNFRNKSPLKKRNVNETKI